MERTRQRQHTPATTSGLPERLALYAFAVGCLIAFLLESPVPMAIAP
jgi:hypothetical protein